MSGLPPDPMPVEMAREQLEVALRRWYDRPQGTHISMDDRAALRSLLEDHAHLARRVKILESRQR